MRKKKAILFWLKFFKNNHIKSYLEDDCICLPDFNIRMHLYLGALSNEYYENIFYDEDFNCTFPMTDKILDAKQCDLSYFVNKYPKSSLILHPYRPLQVFYADVETIWFLTSMIKQWSRTEPLNDLIDKFVMRF